MDSMRGMVTNVEITAYRAGEFKGAYDDVISEHRLEIGVNGRLHAEIICCRTFISELAAGRLLCDGVIGSRDEIVEIKQNPDETAIMVTASPERVEKAAATVAEKYFSARHILALVAEFVQKSDIFSNTGAVHSCAVCDESGFVFFAEDISRHNAIDKAIGHMLLSGIEPRECFVISSGRVPLDCLQKFIAAGVRVVVSKSAVTDMAIAAAKENGITLVGFARGDRLNIYACPERIMN